MDLDLDLDLDQDRDQDQDQDLDEDLDQDLDLDQGPTWSLTIICKFAGYYFTELNTIQHTRLGSDRTVL